MPRQTNAQCCRHEGRIGLPRPTKVGLACPEDGSTEHPAIHMTAARSTDENLGIADDPSR
jgi:hypothetical protein